MELLTALTCSFPRQLVLHHVVTLGPHCSASAPWPCTEPSGGLITAAGPQRTEGWCLAAESPPPSSPSSSPSSLLPPPSSLVSVCRGGEHHSSRAVRPSVTAAGGRREAAVIKLPARPAAPHAADSWICGRNSGSGEKSDNQSWCEDLRRRERLFNFSVWTSMWRSASPSISLTTQTGFSSLSQTSRWLSVSLQVWRFPFSTAADSSLCEHLIYLQRVCHSVIICLKL